MQKHLQICALQDNFQDRDGVLAMPRIWSDFGFSHEQLLHTHADMYSANYDPDQHHDLVADYLKQSQANNLKTIVYMNCHILGPSLAHHYQDWGVYNPDGTQPLLYGTYPSCCLNSPWRTHFFQEIAAFKEFDIEGFFFDGPTFVPCSCPHCQEKYRRIHGGNLAEASDEQLRQFNLETILDFKQDLRRQVKGTNPNWLMYFNEGLTSGRYNAQRMKKQLDNNDIIGTEGGFFFYSSPQTHPYWSCATLAKLAEAVADDRPTVIFFSADPKSWCWTMHTQAESQLCYQASISNGASVWYGLHSTPENLNSKAAQTVKGLVQFDRHHNDLYENTRSRAQLAVFYSFNTSCSYRRSAEQSDLYQIQALQNQAHACTYPDSFQGAAGILEHLSLPYDMVTDLHLTDLNHYDLILAPVLAMVDEATKATLTDYVKNGGTLIMDGEAGWFDENGENLDPKRLYDLLGVTAGTKLDNKRFNYFGLDQDIYTPDNAFNYIQIPTASFQLQDLAPETQVIGRANPALQGCYERKPGNLTVPVVTRHPFGKGQVYFFAMDFFGNYFRDTVVDYRKLIKAIIDQALTTPEVSLLGARPGLMLNLRQCQDGSLLACLNNYISATRPIDEKVPVNGLRLHARQTFTHAQELFSGQNLSQDDRGNWILPELDRIMTVHLMP